MDQKWEIIYYENPKGNSPVFEFIQNLDIKIQSKIATMEIKTAIERLNDFKSR